MSCDVQLDILPDVLCSYIASLPVVRSVLLCGSCARDEHTVVKTGKHREYLSDIEFYVFKENGVQNEVIEKEIQTFMDEQKRMGADVEVEYAIKKPWRAIVLSSRLYNYEALSANRWYGERIRFSGLRASCFSLDKADLSHILFWRTYKVSKAVSTPSFNSDLLTRYILARNVLDCLTYFLYANSILIPSYKERQRYYLEHSRAFEPFIRDSKDLLQRAYLIKKNPMDLSNGTVNVGEALKLLQDTHSYIMLNNGGAIRQEGYFH